jgi:4-carboxymuconolactone decarboxylase
MTRIPYRPVAELGEKARELLRHAPINAMRMMAGASQSVFETLSAYSANFYVDASLTGDLREIAVLRAGYIAGADYVTWQHEVIARDVGLSADQVEAIKAGGAQGHILSPVQQAVMDFVDDVIINVRASDATLAAVRQHLSDEQVIDLIFCTGLYMTVGRLLETAGVERDSQSINAETLQGWFE